MTSPTNAERLARMEEKIDSILFRVTASEGRYTEHDARIRTLETGSSKLLGMGAFAAFVASIFGSNILDWIK